MKKQLFSGFTLIEMLVVIVIILLLGVMLYPSLSRAIESGRGTQCRSNLHQLQLAAMNYANDNDGHVPPSTCSWYQNEADIWCHAHGWVAWTDKTKCTDANAHAAGVYAWSGVTGLACITNGGLYAYVKDGEAIYKCPTFSLKSNCKVTDPQRSYSMCTGANWFNLLAGQGRTDTILIGEDSKLVGVPTADAQCATNELVRWHAGKGNMVFVDGHIEQQ